MARTKVCVWNVQNYGWGSTDSMITKWGVDSGLRNRFIADFVTSAGIDVLLVVEMTELGWPSLRNLAAQLNSRNTAPADKDWAVSYCGSALKKRAPNPPRTSDDLQFKSDGRYEGYAVVWRTNRAGRFSVLNGLFPIASGTDLPPVKPASVTGSPLNLVTKGRLAETVQRAVPPRGGRNRGSGAHPPYEVRDGFTPLRTLPIVGAKTRPWADLAFARTSSGTGPRLPMFGCRRPAYIVLDLGGSGPAKRLCPVAAYHAPSNRTLARWGSFQAGLSRELYATNRPYKDTLNPDPDDLVAQDRTVMGGDFNYQVKQTGWPGDYLYFTSPFLPQPRGGANCTVAPPGKGVAEAERQTTVQIMKGPLYRKIPIPPGPMEDFLALAIDLVFFRGDNMRGARVNVPQALLDDQARTYEATLKLLRTHLQQRIKLGQPAMQVDTAGGPGTWVQRKKAKVWKPLISSAGGGTFTDWTQFDAQLEAGRFTVPRSAAEFFNLFVSDHLPLVVTIDH